MGSSAGHRSIRQMLFDGSIIPMRGILFRAVLSSAFLAIFALILSPARANDAAPAAADAKPPEVPALIVGAKPPMPQSFVVEGFSRSGADRGLGFRVATDAKRQICVLYDAADGTPLFLSDGEQTLIYDLVENRILQIPICRGNVRVDWSPN